MTLAERWLRMKLRRHERDFRRVDPVMLRSAVADLLRALDECRGVE